jgi:hypothetical protein
VTGIVEPVTRRDGKSFGKPTHWYVDATGARIPGVTTILGDGLPKPALINWAANVTAEYAVNNWDDLGEQKVADRLKVLKGARYADRDAAARRGTEVHALAERLARGEQVDVPEELAGHVESYVRFLDEWEPQPVLLEATVYHRQYGYAGTLDMVADLNDGRRLLCDVKTTRSGVYGETAFQLAAYRYADRYLDDAGNPRDMPEVDGCAVIWVRADGYDLVPVRADEQVLTEFRHIAVVARTAKACSGYVGEALRPMRVAG